MSTWPTACPTCGAAWRVRSKTMGADRGQPHRGRCEAGHWWSEGGARQTAAMPCTARIRPMRPLNDTEVTCELHHGPESEHRGTIRDYAYPGSVTTVEWLEGDRRTFHDEWPGDCLVPTCPLPLAHHGDHA